MNKTLSVILAVFISLIYTTALLAGEKAQKKGTIKEVKSLPQEEQIKLALSAAPAHIAGASFV